VEEMELISILEGCKTKSYLDAVGRVTVGIGFNMDRPGARKAWNKCEIEQDFDAVYDGSEELDQESIHRLFFFCWDYAIGKAAKRARELGLDYYRFPRYKQFILADIEFNTGHVHKWRKAFVYDRQHEVLFEARRKPYKLMDNRVAKIGKYYGIINTVEDARNLGLEYATNM